MKRKGVRKWFLVFLLGFLFNLIWENVHGVLYVHYKGGDITKLVLMRAAIVDALIILTILFVLNILKFRRSWIIIIVGIVISIALELWALNTDRWLYSSVMPIIPIINTGYTPTIQLGLLAYIINRTIKL